MTSGRPCRSACAGSTCARRAGPAGPPEGAPGLRAPVRMARSESLRGAEHRVRRRGARRSDRAKLRLLLDDDHFLTVHLDGAPVGGRVALRLRGAVLAPLAQLLLQVLEHPVPPAARGFPPVGMPGPSRPVYDSARLLLASDER